MSVGLVACSSKEADNNQLVITIPEDLTTEHPNQNNEIDKQEMYSQLFNNKEIQTTLPSFECVATSVYSQNLMLKKLVDANGAIKIVLSNTAENPYYEISQYFNNDELYLKTKTPSAEKWYKITEWDEESLKTESLVQSLVYSTENYVNEAAGSAVEITYVESIDEQDIVEIFCGEEMVLMGAPTRIIFRFTFDTKTNNIIKFEKIRQGASTEEIESSILFFEATNDILQKPTATKTINFSDSFFLENEIMMEMQNPTNSTTQEAEQPLEFIPEFVDWEIVIREEQYMLDNSQVEITMADILHMNTIHTPNNENVYSVFGPVGENGYLETTMYQKDDGDIYYHTYEDSIEEQIDEWYICDINTAYDMRETLPDIVTFQEIFTCMESIELIGHETSSTVRLKVYSDNSMPNVLQENGHNIYEVVINVNNYRIQSIEYYYDEEGDILRYKIGFPQHDALEIDIPENITKRIDVLDAHNAVSLSLPRLAMLNAN